MSLMCSMDGCKQKSRMCIHEKMMLSVIVIMAVGAAIMWFK